MSKIYSQICSKIYSKILVYYDLLLLLPKFRQIYLNNKKIKEYSIQNLVDELQKLSNCYSDFLELIEPCELDDDFNNIFKVASMEIGNHKSRCYILYQFLLHVRNLGGDIAEVGVYRGRSASIIALSSRKEKEIYIFDTFEGMPETNPDKDNFYRKGAFSDTSLDEVKQFLSLFSNVNIIQGFFPDTAHIIKEKKFAFVHIDVDIYQSVIDSCNFFYNKLNQGAIMLFDDPGFKTCSGAKYAIEEFFSDKNENIIFLPTGQALIIRSYS